MATNWEPALIKTFEGKRIRCFGADGCLVGGTEVSAQVSSTGNYSLECVYLEGEVCKAVTYAGKKHLVSLGGMPKCRLGTEQAYRDVQ